MIRKKLICLATNIVILTLPILAECKNGSPNAIVEAILIRIDTQSKRASLAVEIKNIGNKAIASIECKYINSSNVAGYAVEIGISIRGRKIKITPGKSERVEVELPDGLNLYEILRRGPVGEIGITRLEFDDGSVWIRSEEKDR